MVDNITNNIRVKEMRFEVNVSAQDSDSFRLAVMTGTNDITGSVFLYTLS